MTDTSSISDLTNEWINLLKTAKEPDAPLDFYCRKIMPELLPLIREKFKADYDQEPQYDGLISLLGFTPETVILSHQFIQPEKIVVIHTEETKDLLDTVKTYANIPSYSYFYESFSEKPNTDIYRALEAALRRFPKGSRIVIELTGGKKTMGGALAIAAGILDIDLIYIDYKEYMREFRKPRPESTYIQLVGNPLKLPVDLFSEVEVNRAVNFFNVGKYDISQTLFEQASNRMTQPRAAELCSELSKLYMLWNSFNFQEGYKLSRELSKRIRSFFGQLSSIFEFDSYRFECQLESLEQLASGSRIHILLNFYFSAERYKENSQNDIAALLYYRTLESVFNNSLQDISSEDFKADKPDYSLFNINTDDLQNKFIEFRESNSKNNSKSANNSLPKKLTMVDALCLLGSLDHPIAKNPKINLGRVMKIAEIRNRSVYAHGVSPIDSQSVNEICKLATDALETYMNIKGMNSIEDQRLAFKFIKLSIVKKHGYLMGLR